jgi:REP element-mobilizing transposase RayT
MSPKFDPKIHHRRSIRLPGYDYSQVGAYFVTLVTHQRKCLFGEVFNAEMVLNAFGQIIQNWWGDLPAHFPGVETGAFAIMPNHVHGIVIITGRGAVPAPLSVNDNNRGGETQGGETPPLLGKKPTLGQIVAYFKYKSTKEINTLDGTGVVTPIWQRNYYERIIRNEREMDAIWRYIEANPANWTTDHEKNP